MEISECNKCGKCREICPSYRYFLNESFSPRGRTQLYNFLKEGELSESKELRERIFSCLLCGACFSNCPLQVDIPFSIYNLREKMRKNPKLLLFKYFSLFPGLFFSLFRILKTKPIKNIVKRQNLIPASLIDKLVPFERKKTQRESLKIFNQIRPKGRIALFLGCSTNYLMPSISNALIKLLSKSKYEVVLPRQNCCGAPLLGAGYREEAMRLAQKNITLYNSFNIDGVMTPCPTCAHFLKDVYDKLTGNSIKILNLDDLIDIKEITGNEKSEKKIFFHLSCHSKNYLKEEASIIKLLKKTGIEMEKKEGCCGFAGLFSFLFERQSMDILKKKVLEYEKADMIITSCPNCIIQFKFTMNNKEVLHYAEFIEKILRKGEGNV
ncbi:(Fe-S)-binding protein [Thermodesulfovibrio sp.]|uniref:(Fe-S)-binding protein n=1 Tax=Thermodesulfovibrio sp. TaxID=2067987 RepID=UPI00309D9C16